MRRKIFFWILLSIICGSLHAQGGEKVYQFLNIPSSVSAAGLGGNSVSSMENDLNMFFHNPATLSTEMDKDFSVGYVRYMADITVGSTAFASKINDRSAWMAGIRYVDYGSMLWTTPEGEILGNTSACDLAMTGGYSWLLSERWRAGGGINFIHSSLEEYVSAAVAVDLGLYYLQPNKMFSCGLVVKNLGAQIVSYNGIYEKMPVDIQLGMTKKLSHAPIRFTLTAQNLLDKSFPYQKTDADSLKSDKWISTFFKHIVGGVEFIPSDRFLLSLGYNYRQKSELGINQRTPFGGFSAGFAMSVKQVRIGASYAKYHISGGALQMTLGMNVSKFGL